MPFPSSMGIRCFAFVIKGSDGLNGGGGGIALLGTCETQAAVSSLPGFPMNDLLKSNCLIIFPTSIC